MKNLIKQSAISSKLKGFETQIKDLKNNVKTIRMNENILKEYIYRIEQIRRELFNMKKLNSVKECGKEINSKIEYLINLANGTIKFFNKIHFNNKSFARQF